MPEIARCAGSLFTGVAQRRGGVKLVPSRHAARLCANGCTLPRFMLQ